MKQSVYTLLLLVLVTAFGCRKMDDPSGNENVPLNLAVQLVTTDLNVVDPTKSAADENTVRDVNVWIFDGAGALLNNYYVADIANAPFELRTTSGQRNMVFVANYGSQISGVITLAAIDALTYTNLTPVTMALTPMVKKTGLITIPSPAIPGGTVSLNPIELTRLTSKVTFTFDHTALNSNVTIRPTKIVLRQVPKSTLMFSDNAPNAASQILARGDSIQVVTGIVSNDHTTAAPLFMLENRQGTTSNIDPKTKTPPSGRSGYVSYFEMTADYRSNDKTGPIVYRFYLGENATSDFNIIRNNWYQVSVQFRGKGGVNENTWRVDVAGLNSRLLPATYYIPYMSGRANYFITPPQWISSIPTIATGDNSVAYSLDSMRIILTKQDNLTTLYSNLGNFTSTSPAATYPIRSVGAGHNNTFIDVSTLLFPRNAQFGYKNYYITQYINIINPTNQASWKAISSADWLYIANGAAIQAFNSTGAVGSAGYASMKNFSSDPLSSSEVTGGSIAVRVTANPSSVARRAQIIFYDEDDEEFGRVYVSQNPAGFPASPVHLAYVAGGIIKAGAFKSDASTPSTAPLQASSTNVYSVISPFYLASKETSAQQFADFMNDVEISSISLLGNVVNTLLGKLGVIISDYRGANPLSLLLPINTSQGAVEYVGGKWVPTKKQFYASSNVLGTSTISIGNYPMNEVSFYAASDYNYWAMKYAGRTPNRLTDALLVSELEWETAARGITNGQTILAVFQASSDPLKNGAYPYAMPTSSAYNSGLTGAETGNVSILKTFAWYDDGSQGWPKSSGGIFNYNIHPSGNLVPNNLGLYDMNGSVGEWVYDNYNGIINLSFLLEVRNENVIYFGLNTDRVVRGGGVNRTAGYNSNVARAYSDPTTLSKTVGFRTIIR